MDNGKIFHDRLASVIATSGVKRVELARHLDVSLPELNRWLNGTSAPNVHQFKAIAQYFGLPYAWFLDEGRDIPDAEDLSLQLGLSEPTVAALLALVEDEEENGALLDAVDTAVQAVLAVAGAVWEDLDRLTDKVIKGMEGKI